MKKGLLIGLGIIAVIATLFVLFLSIWSFVIWDLKPFTDFWEYLRKYGWKSVRVICLFLIVILSFATITGIVEEKY